MATRASGRAGGGSGTSATATGRPGRAPPSTGRRRERALGGTRARRELPREPQRPLRLLWPCDRPHRVGGRRARVLRARLRAHLRVVLAAAPRRRCVSYRVGIDTGGTFTDLVALD